MKQILSIYFLLSTFAFAQTPTPTPAIKDVTNLRAIKIQTPDRGIIVAGDIKDVLINYPALAASAKVQLKTHLDGLDNLSAAKRWKEMQASGVTLPAGVVTNINARLEALRSQRETALRALIANAPVPGPSPSPPPPGASQAIMKVYRQALAAWNVKVAVRRAAVTRAKSKMDELIADGIAITPPTQTIVNAAQPPPAPTPTPQPTPPDDGL